MQVSVACTLQEMAYTITRMHTHTGTHYDLHAHLHASARTRGNAHMHALGSAMPQGSSLSITSLNISVR